MPRPAEDSTLGRIEKVLVVARTKAEDTDWIDQNLPE
jgi:hypothetical protein